MTRTQSEITNIALNNFLDNIGFSSRIFLELKLDKEHQPLLRNFTKDDGITAAYITFIPPDKLVLKKYNAGELQSFQREKYIMKAYEAVRNYNVLIKDLIEYLKYAMNTRKELIHSEIFSLGKNPLTSFITKVAQGLGGAIPGYVLAATGFVTGSVAQPESINTGIILCVLILPTILTAAGAILFGTQYTLDKKAVEEMHTAIAARSNK